MRVRAPTAGNLGRRTCHLGIGRSGRGEGPVPLFALDDPRAPANPCIAMTGPGREAFRGQATARFPTCDARPRLRGATRDNAGAVGAFAGDIAALVWSEAG